MLSMRPLAPNAAPVGVLRDLRPLPRAPRLRRLWPLLLLLALLAGLLAWRLADRGPATLAETRLAGPRGPAPISAVVLLDESGSFREYAALRETLLRQLASWAPDNLRPDDQVTVISFAGDAVTKLEPVTVENLAEHGPHYRSVTVDASSTRILPALEEAVRVAPRGVTTTVIALTDTIVTDAEPQSVAELMRSLQGETLTVVLPDQAGVTDPWQDAFGWGQVVRADPGSVDETGVALATALAFATRQHIEEVS